MDDNVVEIGSTFAFIIVVALIKLTSKLVVWVKNNKKKDIFNELDRLKKELDQKDHMIERLTIDMQVKDILLDELKDFLQRDLGDTNGEEKTIPPVQETQ